MLGICLGDGEGMIIFKISIWSSSEEDEDEDRIIFYLITFFSLSKGWVISMVGTVAFLFGVLCLMTKPISSFDCIYRAFKPWKGVLVVWITFPLSLAYSLGFLLNFSFNKWSIAYKKNQWKSNLCPLMGVISGFIALLLYSIQNIVK